MLRCPEARRHLAGLAGSTRLLLKRRAPRGYEGRLEYRLDISG
jgi:hypothetical protein